MKLNLQFKRIPNNESNRKMVTSGLTPLEAELTVTAASATIEKASESTPSYHAALHLEVPGPDIKASASDYTLAAAWRKVMTAVRRELDRRSAHRKERKTRDTGRGLRKGGAMTARA
jgi:ribosome-associated translation inhibitor RaiA